MDAGEIKAAVSHFLDLTVNGRGNEGLNIETLELSLDMLAWMQHLVEPEDVPRGEEPPGQEYAAMRVLVSQQFPSFGPYRAPAISEEPGGDREPPTRNAVDDLAIIATALFGVAWRFQNTSDAEAIRAFSEGYQQDWRIHLRYLQWFIESGRSGAGSSEG